VRGLHDSEAGLGAMLTRHSRAHRARRDGGMHTQGNLRGTAGGERLRHKPRDGLHREHPRRTVNWELLQGDWVLWNRRTVKPEGQTQCMGEVPFIAAHCMGATRA
jgi:hypothetical protein